MNISPIHTKADHKKALARVSVLMASDPAPGTEESDELEVLAQIVEIYEKKHYDLGNPDPVDLIAFAMEQRGLSKKDMIPYLGSPSRVSEVLNGKRPLTLQMIRNLHFGMGLPLDSLVIGVVQTPVPSASRRVGTRHSSSGKKASPKQAVRGVPKKVMRRSRQEQFK